MEKITPHMYSAGALILIALFLTYQGIFAYSEHVEITNTDLHLRANDSTLEQLGSAKVLNALSGDPKRMVQNPFLEPLKRDGAPEVSLVDIKVPQPPAPIFKLPTPPVLPLPGDQ